MKSPKRSPAAESALRTWVVMMRAHAAVAKHAEADLARHELTPAEFAVLDVLYASGPVLLGELQKKVLVSSGGVTYLVDRLAGRGLAERKECETDRRARYAALTPAGAALVKKILPEHAESIARALGGLSKSELAEVTGLLRQLGRGAAELSPAGAG